MDKVKIAIIGAGGVGGYFAWKFMKNAKASTAVTIVARGAHFDQIQAHGLSLESPESKGELFHPDRLLRTVDEVDTNDIVLICVKDYDLRDVLQKMGKSLHPESVIIPLMNGVDIYSKVKEVFTDHVVLPACVYVASHIKAPGIVEHKGKSGIIIAGTDPAVPNVDLKHVTQAFVNADINFTLKPDASEDIRTKFLFIAGFGLVSARYDKSIGEILADSNLAGTTTELLQEYASILFDSNETDRRVKTALERANAFPYDTRTSLQLDIHGGKAADRNELDLYLRPVVKNEMKSRSSLALRLADEIRSL